MYFLKTMEGEGKKKIAGSHRLYKNQLTQHADVSVDYQILLAFYSDCRVIIILEVDFRG